MAEQENNLEQVYADVVRKVREDGFSSITTADVADVHEKIKMGLSPNGLIGWAIARHLRECLNAKNIGG